MTIWFDGSSQMGRYLDNLRAIRYPNLQLVFIINRATGKEVEQLKTSVPRAFIIEPGRNLGTAAAWNLGMRRLLPAGAKYIEIWNLDVRLDPSCIDNLVATLEQDPSIGVAAPLLFYSDQPDVVEMYGGSLDNRTGKASHDYVGTTDSTVLPAIRDSEYLDGGTMMMRAEVLRRIGDFDEDLFMYAEDADLCLRTRRAGYRTVAVRRSVAWHYHRQEKGLLHPPHEMFYGTRNQFRLVRKHFGSGTWRGLVLLTLGKLPRQLFYFLRRHKVTLAVAYATGVLYGILGWMGKRGWVEA
jgi:GT2 family glycosyltransferase